MNVETPEADRLAHAIARATGMSVERVLLGALRQYQANVAERRSRAGVEDLLAIARRAAKHLERPYLDDADLLYDENGLPHFTSTKTLVDRSKCCGHC